jgi:hypothetical protein
LRNEGCIQASHGLPHNCILRGGVYLRKYLICLDQITFGHGNRYQGACNNGPDVDGIDSSNTSVDGEKACDGRLLGHFDRDHRRPDHPQL